MSKKDTKPDVTAWMRSRNGSCNCNQCRVNREYERIVNTVTDSAGRKWLMEYLNASIEESAHYDMEVSWYEDQYRTMEPLLREILAFRKGEGEYNFAHLDDYDRVNATNDAWSAIEAKIVAALA